ncbi:MAG: hypothetical protein ACREHG_09535 [Candidatus Saccharimonadales bacterium]
MPFKDESLRYKRILEIIEEIYIIATNRSKWYLDSKVTDRLRWLKNLEED